jgi:perosamine synthetase
MKELPVSIVEAIRNAIGRETAVLHEPRLGEVESKYVQDCIDSTFVSSVGEYVTRFEENLAAYVGVKRAVAVVNGTSALQVALRLAGVSAGDEVFTSPLTFIATANAISYLGATAHFVDCCEKTLGLDPVKLKLQLEQVAVPDGQFFRNRETGARLRAVVPMHTFGHPCEMFGIMEVANQYGLVVVEDAAESLGSTYHDRHTGSFGRISATSFNGNKIITTGGGGAILTDDTDLADRAKFLTATAKMPHRWEYVHNEIGYNFRMPNLNAAMGCAQLENIDKFLGSKKLLAQRYLEEFSSFSNVRLFLEPSGCRSNYWLQALILDESVSSMRDAILQYTNDCGLQTRPAWRLMHRLQPYQHCPRGGLEVAESLEKRIVNIPSSAGLV